MYEESATLKLSLPAPFFGPDSPLEMIVLSVWQSL